MYHVERRTEGAEVPQHIMKVAKSLRCQNQPTWDFEEELEDKRTCNVNFVKNINRGVDNHSNECESEA